MVSIGLFASLLPRTSFVPRSSGEVVDAIGPVWPHQLVEQDLGYVEAISEVRIWARAPYDRGEAPIVASLFQGQAEEPVRQIWVRIQASNVLVPHILVFPPHKVAPGEKLTLRLWVSPRRENSVFFRTGERGTGPPAVVNRQPTGRGPLAYEVIWRGTGWRAALEGSTADLARLAGAIAAAALAFAITVLSHPFISRTLRKTMRRVKSMLRTLAGPIPTTLQQAQIRLKAKSLHANAPARRRGFYVFPWLIPIFAILHYVANNLLLFRVSESVAVFVVTMAVVTVAFIAFRLAFKNTAIAAVITGLLGTAFFSYGHVSVALGDRADDRYLLGLGVPTVLSLGALVRGRLELARRVGSILNFGSVVLLAAPVYQIALVFYTANSPQTSELPQDAVGLEQRAANAKARFSPNELRDIYYIILDEYPRSGSPPEFDNSEFVRELESRGFYVAPNAQSDSPNTIHSIPSSLNMTYPDELVRNGEMTQLDEIADDHALGRTLKALGYQYVHVSSGWILTDTSRNADLLVDFAPSGRILAKPETTGLFSFQSATRLSRRSITTFLRTTAARLLVSREFSAQRSGDDAYDWRHPFRTLAWLDFMKEVGTMERPKFVFAHLLKPHSPYSFDKFGEVNMDLTGWSDDHDPTVNSAFHGQLIWLNGRMLEVIDAILDDYEEPPIIVIAGDHGHRHGHKREGRSTNMDILAAFLLPDGGETALYPSITSVNHFRAILDYYFGLNLGLLEDRVYNSGG